MGMDKNIKLTINGNSAPKQTNYDRIKSMSVEEMAEWIAALTGNATLRDIMGRIIKDESSIEVYKQWLLQEVSEDE